MKYTSTRDKRISCSFEEALCSGYAPDGGLFVPVNLPRISSENLQLWSKLTYPQLSEQILRMFISSEEIPDADLTQICAVSFRGFETPNHAVPVRRLGSYHIAELFHGPTFCFKDLAMQVVVNVLSYFSNKNDKQITLLVATTGDTGPAAVRAVSDVDNWRLNVLVHYPHGQISDFQRKQLTTIRSPCVRIAAFEGDGDDMDRPIKNILSNSKDPKKLVTGINSYNIGRPLVQMVHFVWSYLRVLEAEDLQPNSGALLDFVLPTGAMGNIAGGYMAKKMGLPIGKLTAGTNINDISHRVVQTGLFHRADTMHKTLSDAINIQVPYNFERLLYYLTDQKDHLVREWMTTMDETSRLSLNKDWLKALQQDFGSARVTDQEMCGTLLRIHEDFSYLADPNTSVALCAAEKLGYDVAEKLERPVVILATASPCKFEESVIAAVGQGEWDRYVKEDFPPSGRAILDLPDNSPEFYNAQGSLSESQANWEGLALNIVHGFTDQAPGKPSG